MKRTQVPWAFGVAAGIFVIAVLPHTMRPSPPLPSSTRRLELVPPSDGSGVPSPSVPRTEEPGAPAADAERPPGARTRILRELREARREARRVKPRPSG